MMMKILGVKFDYISLEKLSKQKELSREIDQKDLESGKKDSQHLARENGFFAFPSAKIKKYV